MTAISKWLPIVLVAGLLVTACGEVAAPTGRATQLPVKETRAPAQADWEQKWDALVTAAKSEGSVSVYAAWTPEVRNGLTQAFKNKYGINVEFTPFSKGAELPAKVMAEQRAGLYAADVFGAGISTFLLTMKPEGVLGSLKPMLILPDVVDPKGWSTGGVPFSDEQGLTVSLIGLVVRTVVYNTELIKEGEITSYQDLLKPQYKGKITLMDPSVTGSGNGAFSHLGLSLWDEAKAVDFLRKLIVDQQAVIQIDSRIHVESVARGKYAIAFAPLPDVVAQFANLGAPVKMAIVKEDNRLSAGTGAVAVPKQLAHPNAAMVFVNWLLSQEGQTVFARAWGNPSTRTDVSVEGIDPLFVPVAGQKYYGESEDALQFKGAMLAVAKRVMNEAAK